MGATPDRLMPVYLVVDVSWSMSTHGRLEAAERMIGTITGALRRRPDVARRVRLGVIDFSQDACVRLPLCDPTAAGVEPPRLRVGNGTNFGAAFTAVRRQLDADAGAARPEGAGRSGPPTVFFMSDGGPTDDERTWRAAFAALVAHPAGPAVVPCGIDEAEAHVMGSLIHPLTGPARTALFMMADGAPAAAAIAGIGEVVVASLLGPGTAEGRPVLPGPAGLPPAVVRHEPEEFG